jgi:hypothetical protein
VKVPREPPQLAAPHPLPVTMAFIYEGLKRLRAVNALSQVRLRRCASWEKVVVGEWERAWT